MDEEIRLAIFEIRDSLREMRDILRLQKEAHDRAARESAPAQAALSSLVGMIQATMKPSAGPPPRKGD